MRGTRNNLLAGTLVIGCIVGAIIIVVMLAGGLEKLGKHDYRVRFSIADGVTGLEAGSRVLVGGRPVGVVKELDFDITEGGEAAGVEVVISIDRRIKLRQGSTALLVSPLLGGSGTINFRSTGEGEGEALDRTDVIDGRIAPPTMLAQAGYGEQQAQQVQNIIKNINDASEKLNTTLDDAKYLASDTREKWPAWSGRIDSITMNADEAMAKAPKLAEDVRARVESVRELLATAQGYLDENRENVKQGLDDFRAIADKGDAFMTRLNGELTEKVSTFLDDARSAFARAREAVDGVAMLKDEQLPNIRRMMANFRLASDQLALTLAEVRRSPWRLLYRPDKRELNFELLYDATRTYAAAVGDLRGASESIESLKADASALSAHPERLDGMLLDLEGAFGRYKEAEAEFLRQVMMHADGKNDGGVK